MKKIDFKKIMVGRGFDFIKGYWNGYTLIKDNQKYFIGDNIVDFLNDISYLNIEEYKF